MFISQLLRKYDCLLGLTESLSNLMHRSQEMYICASKYLFRSHSFVPFLSSISSKKEVASKPQTFLIAPLFHVLQPGLVDLVPKDANWQVSNRSLCTYLKLQTDKIYCVSKEKPFLFVWQTPFLLYVDHGLRTTRRLNLQFFATYVQILIPNKYLGGGHKVQVFRRNNG